MYYKKVDYNSNKECFEFLTNHFEYDTMNSWNGLRSIAHNVKLYNLPVNYEDAVRALEEDEYFQINQTIKDWEEEHPGTEVGFNGRSGGYLVLRSSEHNGHIFENDHNSPIHYDDYENWKADVQMDWGSLKAYHSELVYQVKLVQEFDKLCDDLVEVVKWCIQEMKDREARTFSFDAVRRFERYYYPTIDDLHYHKEYMLQRGYSVWEQSDEDLYAEYEMNESVEGQVTLEE